VSQYHPQPIYIVIGTFHPLVGGAELQALAQGRILREKGYETTIITFRYKKQWPAQELIEGVPVIRVAGSVLHNRERYPRAIQQLLYLLSLLILTWTLWQHRHRYDILHVYQLSLLALPTALASYLTRKPMLISVRSTGSGKPRESRESATLLAGPLDPATPWLQVDGQTWVDGDLESLLRMGRPIVRFTYNLLKHISAKVIVLSTRMQAYLAAHDFLLPGIQLIPNGVDIIRYSPLQDSASFATRAHVVICVSKLRYEKGIDVLLQAWYLVQQHHPAARLVIVGSGPLQQALMQMAQALAISGSVEFAGLQSNIPAQLHRGGLAVLPSRWEGMPNAVLEAMACELPCVATRVSGSEDIIQHGINGLLVDVGDYKALAQALLTLLNDPDLAQQYGRAARATIEAHYSLEHVTQMHIQLYQDLLNPILQKGLSQLSVQDSTAHQRQVLSCQSEDR
jgi:glycosyltransferase involved in cell wall biosynthesis